MESEAKSSELDGKPIWEMTSRELKAAEDQMSPEARAELQGHMESFHQNMHDGFIADSPVPVVNYVDIAASARLAAELQAAADSVPRKNRGAL